MIANFSHVHCKSTIGGYKFSFSFNKFYQGDSSHESEGNGLGLALVRKIVAIHGGEVWVEDPVNGGCRFAVRLPVEK